MRLRLITGLTLAFLVLVVSPASGDPGLHARKDAIDSRLGSLAQRIAETREREGVLSSQIAAVTSKIRALDDDVGVASARLGELESVLARSRERLDRLNELYALQTRRLGFLQRQRRSALARLNERVVEMYTSEPTSPVALVLEASTFSDLIDQIEFMNTIGRQDRQIADEVERAKLQMQQIRNETRRTRRDVAATTRQIAARTAEQRAVRDRLAWSQGQLATARRDKSAALADVKQTREQFIAEADGLRADSAALAARIRAAQASTAAAPAAAAPAVGPASSAGFVWPLQGTVTSYFGTRWGRMHEGLDIAAPYGTPVVASAAGTVISAGWGGGYGYLVVIDHGNGIATAYAHNASLTVSAGQQVAQGQLIAYVGSTGNSTGPHVHFEVRSGGAAVDPLGYL